MRFGRNKHRRHAVKAGDLLLIDASQRGFCGEVGHGTHGCAMGHGGGHGKGHAEAVEHRHLDHHAVGGGKTHPVTDTLAVVDHIVVGQHNALGEAGGAGGILHVANIIRLYQGGASAHLFPGDQGRAGEHLLPGKTTIHIKANRYNVFKERQLFGVERLACLQGFKLGAKRFNDFLIVRLYP